jgi:hypothetical protein
MIKKIFLIGVLLSMCFSNYCDNTNQPKKLSKGYSKIADKITMQFAAKMKQKKNLVFIGLGGAMMGDIQEMDVSFNYSCPINIPTARKLIIECAKEYLQDINDNKEVQPYLHDHPFTAQNIQITIFIHNVDDSRIYYPNLCNVNIINNTVRYLSHDGEKFVSLKEEPYDEAMKIVEKEANKK